MSEKIVVVALGHRALGTTLPEQKVATKAAAKAIASFVTDDLLSADYIIPSALDKNVATAVAEAVAKVAKETGVARI